MDKRHRNASRRHGNIKFKYRKHTLQGRGDLKTGRRKRNTRNLGVSRIGDMKQTKSREEKCCMKKSEKNIEEETNYARSAL